MLGHSSANVSEADLSRGVGCEYVPDAAVCCVTTGAQEDCPALIGIVDVVGGEVEVCPLDVGLPVPRDKVERTKGTVGRQILVANVIALSSQLHKFN